MKQRALILDFGGVVSRTLFETHAQTEAALGLEAGTLTWRGPFAPETDALWQSMQGGEISERDYWLIRSKEVGELLGEKWDDMQTLVRRARGNQPNNIIRPETLALIETAHRAGHKLAILSNELDLFYGKELRQKLDCLRYFDCIMDATYTGILKPDPRAYQAVLHAINMPAERCIFVDDQTKNIEGALSLRLVCEKFNVMHPQNSCDAVMSWLLAQ